MTAGRAKAFVCHHFDEDSGKEPSRRDARRALEGVREFAPEWPRPCDGLSIISPTTARRRPREATMTSKPGGARVRTTGSTIFVLCAGGLLGSAGCEASVGSSDGTEETSSTTEAFGESTCGSSAADYDDGTLQSSQYQPSANGSYNHAGCAHAYIATTSVTAGKNAWARYDGPIVPPSWGCNGMWVNLSLWQFNPITLLYQKVADAPEAFGKQFGSTCAPPDTTIAIPGAGAYKLVAQAGYATAYEAVELGTPSIPTLHNMSSSDSRGYTGDGDWAPNLYKGECAVGQDVIGVSRAASTPHRAVNVLCGDGSAWLGQGAPAIETLDISSGDDRLDTTHADWDAGFRKAECGEGYGVVGLAQTPAGVLDRVECFPLAVFGSQYDGTCTTLTITGGDARASSTDGDWSYGDAKGQCGPGEILKGISRDASGYVRSLFCCETMPEINSFP
jgi:hypothetical protein